MKKILFGIAVAGAAAGAAVVPAHAATSASLTVQGNITPPACTLSLTDATVDFGTRTFGALDAGGTILPTQTTTIQVACEGSTRVSFSAVDNRPGTAIDSSAVTVWPALGTASADRAVWGLGTAGVEKAKIGALEVAIPTWLVLADGQTAGSDLPVMTGPLGSATWGGSWYSSTIDLVPNKQYTVSTKTGPKAIKNLSFPLQLAPVIARPATLPAEDELELDGSLTLTLHYL